MGTVTEENVAEVVRHHVPTLEQAEVYESLTWAAEVMILAIIANCPPCADTSAAIRHVREAKMTACAAVALNGMI